MEEQLVLDWIPEATKIEDVVIRLPNSKSPGLDGIIVEVLCKCRDWLREECEEVFQHFWSDGVLTPGAIKGVIHLIPKLGELFLLHNWRPITLMTLLYKIISKLLANRMK